MKKYFKGFICLFILFAVSNVYATPANDSFLDDNLYKCIIDSYNNGKEEKKDYTYNILPEELVEINTLDCSNYKGKIEDLTGLNKLISLTSLNLSGNTFLGGTLKLTNNYGRLASNLNLPASLTITDKKYTIENNRIVKIANDLVYPLEAGSTYVTLTGKVSGNEITEKYLVSVNGGTVKKSSNSKLASLFLTASNLKKGEGEFSFDSNTKLYSTIVNGSVTKVKVNATVLDRNAKFVSGYGPREVTLKSGTNTIEVKVKAQDDSESTYVISIIRSDGNDANNKLANIELSVGKINFNRDVYNYNFNVETNVDTIDIRGIAESPLSKVTVTDINSNITSDKATSKLKIGSNKIVVSVSSESGNKQDYTLNITREDYDSEDNYLSNLSINGYTINFNRNIFNYNLNIKDENSLVIVPTVEKSNATYSIVGNNNLVNNSKISIKVSDENGSIREYVVTVHKEEANATEFSSISLKWIILIVEVVTIVVLLMYIIFRGSKKPRKPKKPKKMKKAKIKMVNQPSTMNNYGNKCKSCGTINDVKSKTCYVCGNQLK